MKKQLQKTVDVTEADIKKGEELMKVLLSSFKAQMVDILAKEYKGATEEHVFMFIRNTCVNLVGNMAYQMWAGDDLEDLANIFSDFSGFFIEWTHSAYDAEKRKKGVH